MAWGGQGLDITDNIQDIAEQLEKYTYFTLNDVKNILQNQANLIVGYMSGNNIPAGFVVNHTHIHCPNFGYRGPWNNNRGFRFARDDTPVYEFGNGVTERYFISKKFIWYRQTNHAYNYGTEAQAPIFRICYRRPHYRSALMAVFFSKNNKWYFTENVNGICIQRCDGNRNQQDASGGGIVQDLVRR